MESNEQNKQMRQGYMEQTDSCEKGTEEELDEEGEGIGQRTHMCNP